MPATPVVPETITVHLGPPGSSARNVEVPFSPLRPIQPENA